MMLDENKKLLLKGYEELNQNDNLANTVDLLNNIHQNIMFLTTAADF